MRLRVVRRGYSTRSVSLGNCHHCEITYSPGVLSISLYSGSSAKAMVSSWGGGGDEERRVAPVLDLSYCISDACPGDSAQGSLYMTRDTNSPHKIIRRGQTGRIIAPTFALIMEQKGTPNYVSQAKSAKVLTADCRRLYPVNYSYNSSAPNLLFSSTTSTRS